MRPGFQPIKNKKNMRSDEWGDFEEASSHKKDRYKDKRKNKDNSRYSHDGQSEEYYDDDY
jgi:hypothetical protein